MKRSSDNLSIHSKVWLTSFGDLLTLLLCFFLVTIYHGRTVKSDKVQLNQDVSAVSSQGLATNASLGKVVASKQVLEFPHAGLHFGPTDFSEDLQGLSETGEEKLEKLLAHSEAQIAVDLCSENSSVEVALIKSISRAAGRRFLRYRLGADTCRRTQEKIEENQEPLAVLSLNVTNNGR